VGPHHDDDFLLLRLRRREVDVEVVQPNHVEASVVGLCRRDLIHKDRRVVGRSSRGHHHGGDVRGRVLKW